MFVGEFVHSLDDKHRLAIPAKFRPPLADGFFITKGVDRCLYVYTNEDWKRIAGRLAALSSAQAHIRQLQRHFFAGAADATLDKLGRVVIPQPLRTYAQLEGEIAIVGVYGKIEVWNHEAWTSESARADSDTAALAERIAELEL